uniref:Uncharacterized protein n=1 Tax=Meloidogyne hapla TaxID=6305 RepID=A0A1I8BPR4_MELHA
MFPEEFKKIFKIRPKFENLKNDIEYSLTIFDKLIENTSLPIHVLQNETNEETDLKTLKIINNGFKLILHAYNEKKEIMNELVKLTGIVDDFEPPHECPLDPFYYKDYGC